MKLELLKRLNQARAERRAVVLVTDTQSGEQRLVEAGEAAADPLGDALATRLRSGRSGMAEDGVTFLTVYVPPPRLVMIGAVHISQALSPMARLAGFDPLVIDPRTAFASPERFAGVPVVAEWPDEALKDQPLDAYTALAALTHDPKIDDMPIRSALETGCFYVGALGSRKTHAKRVERLMVAGLSSEQIDRIDAPIGADIGAQSPAEIAVAVLAEIIAALRKGPAPVRAAA
jgi:xanthine dehydrogenase accessory factor